MMTDIFVELMLKIQEYSFDTYATFANASKSFLYVFAVLYFIGLGVGLVIGKVKARDVAICYITMALAATIALNPTTYTNYVSELFSDTTLELASYFSTNAEGTGLDAIFNKVDSTFSTLVSYSENMEPTGNFLTNAWLYIKAGAGIGLLGFFYLATIVCFVGLFIMSWFCMHVLFVLGGIMIFFAGFDRTRFIFFGWLRSIFTHSLVIIFASLSLSISLWLLEKSLTALAETDITQGVFTPQYFASLILSILSVFLLLKCPDLASGLTGGFAGRTSTLAAFMSGAGSMGMGQTMTPMQGLAGQAGRAGMGAGARLLSNIGPAATRAFSYLKGLSK